METPHSHSTTVERYHTKISVSANCDRTSQFSSPDDPPAASPLDSLEAVLSWSPGADDFCVPVVPLKEDNGGGGLLDDPTAPKLIVCHDMMGGYKKDRFVQGHLDTEDYYLYHWQHISAFIYFSHHFVTLPPPTWTNAAHRNGTLSMGTIITEWQEGAKLCHQLFSSEVTLMQFSQQLVAVAQYYRFDGWLVNIENPIHPNCVANLYMFLSLLTTGMHEACPGSKVIWYDSVTVTGELKWQNQLNERNKPFFDLCDGIFLNYNWNGGGLGASRELAGGRKGEVYVGIDVFGRGCFGGGGYNSDKALQVISRQGLSAAVFAPGWVFETQDKANFFQNEDKFWTLLSPYCPPSVPLPLPLVSSFGRGCGDVIAIDGKVVYAGSWTNLSAQDLQPSFTGNPTDFDPQRAINVNGVTVNTTSAYNNGASLKLQGRFRKGGSAKLAVIRLFKVDVSLREPLFLTYTFSGDPASGVRHYVQLKTSSKTVVLLDPNATPAANSKPSKLLPGYGLPRSHEVPLPSWCSHHLLAPLPEPHGRALQRLFTGSSKQVEAWKTSYFLVQCEALSEARVEEVSIALCPDTSGNHKPLFGLDIGELKILDPRCVSPDLNPSTITNIHCQDIQCYRCHQHHQCTNDTLSLTLKWLTIDNTVDPVEHCNIYSSCIIGNLDDRASCWQSDYVYLGRAYASCFRVIGLDLLGSDLEFSFEFRVQPVTFSQRKPGVEESPCIVVQVTP